MLLEILLDVSDSTPPVFLFLAPHGRQSVFYVPCWVAARWPAQLLQVGGSGSMGFGATGAVLQFSIFETRSVQIS